MYFYKNGKKVKHQQENFKPAVKENYSSTNGAKKCPTWVFIVLGIIAALVAAWLIYCIVKNKKNRKSSMLNF
jgi:H+/Cl- antiporter ClcA